MNWLTQPNLNYYDLTNKLTAFFYNYDFDIKKPAI